MRLTLILLLILSASFSVEAQQYTLETTLDNTVSETSGLIYINNTLITHNDSSNANELYDIDLTTGNVTRTVTVSNVTNTDWEDITYDENYIYIGDFGNYDATRTNLRVLRIPIADYFNSTSVSAEIINFNYLEQTDFSVQEFSTNFDAEALIHFNNKLYIFTKNWADLNSNIYELPKTPGTYTISQIDVIQSDGLVTGATLDMNLNSIVLCGYDLDGPFLIQLNDLGSGLFSNATFTKTSINPPSGYSFQTEGIAPLNGVEYLVSAEEADSFPQGLYRINLSTLTNAEPIASNTLGFYPNPAKTTITLNKSNCITKIYSVTGQCVKISEETTIDVSDLAAGIYLVKIKNEDLNKTQIKRLIIEH
jgi:hypothetical protein